MATGTVAMDSPNTVATDMAAADLPNKAAMDTPHMAVTGQQQYKGEHHTPVPREDTRHTRTGPPSASGMTS